MKHPVYLGSPARAYDSMPHPAQTLTNHRGHHLSFGPDRHETEISIRKIIFHDEIRPQSFRPVITNPVLYASPALCQATQAPPGSLPRSDPTGKCELPNQLSCTAVAG